MNSKPAALTQGDISQRAVLEDISIVIPTLGRTILEQSLSFIVSGDTWPRELIIVDQGSSSKTAACVRSLNDLGIAARYVSSNQIGRAAGLNRGLECVGTQFVAITDDDCFVDREWLENIHNRLREFPESIVTGRVGTDGNHSILLVKSTVPAVYRRPSLKFDIMSGGNMGTSADVIRRVGLFDEDPRIRTAEDVEWSYRALRKGIPIIYAPEVSVTHFGWRNQVEMAEQFRDYAHSHGGFYGKYIRKGDMFILVRAILHHLRALRWWFRGRITGNAELVLSGKAYFKGLLPGIMAGFQIS